MANPTTIIDYATERRDEASQAVSAVQSHLSAAQKKGSELNAQLALEIASSVSLNKSAADIRQKLSAIATPADGETLLDELEQVIIRQRAAQSAVVDIQTDIAVAQADAKQAQADLATASAKLRAAEAALTSATQGKVRRDAWNAALAADPLKSMDAAATDALKLNKNTNYKSAKKRIEDDIPEKLRTRATDRRMAVNKRINAAADSTNTAAAAIVAEHTKNGSLTEQARDLWDAFLAVEATTGAYVSTAATRFDQAQANLAAVGDKTNSPLTTEEIDRINTSDAALETARENAVDAEKNVADLRADLETKQGLFADAVVAHEADPTDAAKTQAVSDKQQDVNTARGLFDPANDKWTSEQSDYAAKILDLQTKQAALDEAIQKAIAAKADPNTDPGVTAAKGALAKAQQDLQKAEDVFKESSQGILGAWEAAVPDATWRLFEDFEQAEETLTELSTKSAGQISNDLAKAEADYITAQIAADDSADVLAQLTAEQQARAAREAAARQAAADRRFSALRGDN